MMKGKHVLLDVDVELYNKIKEIADEKMMSVRRLITYWAKEKVEKITKEANGMDRISDNG